ncbi:hypothetical protein [Marininema halotolerans]|uniref:YtkA-like n=1 Tax=Marininema halotolerans TaxID=1155944 RepID=A0A1I6RX84_9BACL|nr:hypothetical protein [Marininema halotolerans]SFS69309.1 hypothetical protein SAMN05444972_10610 [Marininema halotolerans]
MNRIKTAVILLLFLIGISALPSFANAHGNEAHPPSTLKNLTTSNEDIQLTVEMPAHPEVGKISHLSFHLIDRHTKKPIDAAKATIQVMDVEDQPTPLLKLSQIADNGTFFLNYHFFDGAPQQMNVTVTPLKGEGASFQPLTHSFDIKVTPIQPPTSVVVKTLLFLVFLAFIGFLPGFLFAKSSKKFNLHQQPIA